MIHYHGTPITPTTARLEMAGRCFCVRYGEHRDIDYYDSHAQSLMLDNGAFSKWTKNLPTDWDGFANWARTWLDRRTTWAVMPDVIGGTEEENHQLIVWLSAAHGDVWRRSAPVWHMHEPLDVLKRLCHGYERVCIGSSGEYREVGTSRWKHRLDEAFNAICPTGNVNNWIHMLRAMDEACVGDWPFSSADSTNVARNHAGNNQGRSRRSPRQMADEIDARQPPAYWIPRYRTGELEIVA